MTFLTPSLFKAMVITSEESFKKISEIITKYEGNNSGELFMKACHDEDYKTANNVLNKTIYDITEDKTDNNPLRSSFLFKFPEIYNEIENDLLNISTDRELVLLINRYHGQFCDVINKNMES